MATWIEVQTTDVVGRPVQSQSVQIALDESSQFQPLQPAASGDGFTAEITGASQIELKVQAKGFWDISQHVDLTDGDPPTIKPSPQYATYNLDDYEINVDPPVIHSAAGGDWVVTINVRLSHIRDAETKAREILRKSHEPQPQLKVEWAKKGWAQFYETEMDFDLNRICPTAFVQKTVLGPEGATGPDRLNTLTEAVSPGGTLYFFERTTTPKLVLVWQPSLVRILDAWFEEAPVPLHYHLFFHPAIHWPDHPPGEEPYPWNFDSLNLPHRYLMGRPPRPSEDPPPDQLAMLQDAKKKEKYMLNQLVAAEAPVNFVYPVGKKGKWMGDIVNQAGALLLLQEINHFLQRRVGAEVALHPIGRIGVSGFSYGYNGPVMLASSTPAPDFDEHWYEIYNFDANDYAFVGPTRRWLLKRPDQRRLRIYSQSGIWLAMMSSLFPGLKPVKRFGAQEMYSFYSGSVAFLPPNFWSGAYGPHILGGQIHQVIPALFLHHAMSGWFLY